MSLYLFILFMLAVIVFCVITIRYMAVQAHEKLKASLTSISDHYAGIINDTGGLKDISVKFNLNNFTVIVKTVIKRRRKCTNSYFLLIALFDSLSDKMLIKREMLIKEAIHHQKLMAEISSMLNTIKTDQV